MVHYSRTLVPYHGDTDVSALCCSPDHSGIKPVSVDAADPAPESSASAQVVAGVLSDGRLCLWSANDDEEAVVTPVTASDSKDEPVDDFEA